MKGFGTISPRGERISIMKLTKEYLETCRQANRLYTLLAEKWEQGLIGIDDYEAISQAIACNRLEGLYRRITSC